MSIESKENGQQNDANLSIAARLVGPAVLFLARRMRVEIENPEYLEEARKHLATGSLIVFPNHLAVLDPLIVYNSLLEYLGGGINKVFIPATSKFPDGRMGRMAEWVYEYVSANTIMQPLPIVQPRDETYSDKERAGINSGVFKKMIRGLGKPGNIVLIFPEGTRSREGKMAEVRRGAGRLVKLCDNLNTLVVPMGIIGSTEICKTGSNIPNPFSPIKVTVGKPLKPEALLEQAEHLGLGPESVVALHIAALLPEEYRGYYGQDSFPDFYERYAVSSIH